MPKAINWPKQFEQEILNEDTQVPKIAIRLGRLYFDTNYFSINDIVDIRVDNKVVRKGQILTEMGVAPIKDIPVELFQKCYKKSLNSHQNVIVFLNNTYNKEVNENTEVTVISYRNLPAKEFSEAEDPHLL